MEKEKTRLSITMSGNVYENVQRAAAELGISVSAWLNVAAAEKLKRDNRTKK